MHIYIYTNVYILCVTMLSFHQSSSPSICRQAPARDRAGYHPRAEPTHATAQALRAEGEIRGAEIH